MKLKHLVVAALVAISLTMAQEAKALTSGTFTIGTSTPVATAVLLRSGAGQLSEVEITSATAAGGYCLFVDSSNIQGITTAYDGRIVAGVDAAPIIAAPTAPAVNTVYTSKGGPFTNGLVAICDKLRRVIARVSY